MVRTNRLNWLYEMIGIYTETIGAFVNQSVPFSNRH